MVRMTIVLAEPADWVRYRAIRLAALADAPYAFGATLATERTWGEREWRNRLTRGRYYLGMLTDDGDGQPMATAGAISSATPAHPDDVQLVGVWAAPAARGTGLADAVVSAVVNEAPGRVHAWVAATNHAALRLYTRLGFRLTGARQPLPSDQTRDEVALVRDPD
jgi:ribosomal protein S18 acetylase RimI-like enzyme